MRDIFKRKTNVWFYVILFFIILFAFNKLIYPLGPRVANDFHLAYREVRLETASMPWTWNNAYGTGLGEYSVFVLWTWPLGVITSVFFLLSSQQITLLLFLVVLPVVFGSFGIKKIVEKLDYSPTARFISVLVYFLNTYFILLLDGGQFNIVVAYGFFPLVFYVWKESLSLKIKPILISSISVALLGFLDIRILYILAVLIFIDFLFNARDFIKYVISGTGALAVFVLLHAYWIMPSILSKAPSLPVNYERSAQVTFLSFAKWKHAILFLQPHWYKNIFGKVVNVKWEFALIPILMFMAPLLAWVNLSRSKTKRIKEIGFWFVVALISVFLVKGANPPLPGVYPWLFTNIPGFSLFRDPTKFFFLLALSYSILIGFTVDTLIKVIDWKVRFLNWNISIIAVLMSIYLLLLIYPAWLGKMTGLLSEPIYQKESGKVAETLRSEEMFGRVFWIPTKTPLGYFSPTHPSVEASRLVQKRPFAVGVVGNYEQFNFVREAEYMGELFDIAAIKYIAYPYPDTRREELKVDNIDYYNAFSDQIASLDWIEEKIIQPPVAVFKTKKVSDHFFIAQNTHLIIGSDDINKELISIRDFELRDNALIFSEELPGRGVYAEHSDSVIMNRKAPVDFAATFIDDEKFITPASFLNFDPDDTGWWKRETADLVWYRDFLQHKYELDNQDFDFGKGYAIAEGDLRLTLHDSRFKHGNVILARVMISSKGGKIGFYQGQELVGEINTKYENSQKTAVKLTGYGDIPDQYFGYDRGDLLWFEVGKLSSNDRDISIDTNGEINVVNAIVSINEDEWTSIKDRAGEYKTINWKDVLYGENGDEIFTNTSDVEVSYKRMAPTKYEVSISGVEKPVTLAFSETFDPLWEIDGESSRPLYSLINGFRIQKDGTYVVNFSAQMYILPGLIVSAITLLSLLAYLFLKKPAKI